MSALLDTEADLESAPTPALTPDRARRLVTVAFRPAIVTLTLLAALILVVLVAANSELTGTAGAIAAVWLAVHQVPITISGTTIGVLPLLPTIGLLWLVARECARAIDEKTTNTDVARVIAAAVGGPLVITVVCLAVIKDASGVIALEPPNTLAAFAWVLVLHLGGALVGVGTQRWRQVVVARQIPGWAVAGLLASGPALRRFFTGAAIVTAISFFASWSTVTTLLHTSDGFVGSLGLIVLSIAYLPNVIVGSAAVLTGASAHFGAGAIGIFGVVGGPVPGLPVMAAVPVSPAGTWWPALLLVPVYVAVRLGRDCASNSPDRWSAAKAAAAASWLVGIAMAAASFAAGGELGSFGDIGADLICGPLGFGWLAVLGSVTAVILGRTIAADPVDPTPEEPVVARVVAPQPALEAEIVEDAPVVQAQPIEVVQHEPADIIDAEVVDLPNSAPDLGD